MHKNRSSHCSTFKTNVFFRALPIVALMLAASQMIFGARVVLAAVTLTATKTAALGVDANNNGQLNSGDTLGYTVVVNNTGDIATNAAFTDTIDANTTLVANSLKTTPIARNDGPYNAVTNVTLNVPVEQGVLVNDNDPDGSGPLTLLSSTFWTNHGRVTLNADGSFTYLSNSGFTGTDTFNYTVKDTDNNQDTATVTIVVSQPVGLSLDRFQMSNALGVSTLTSLRQNLIITGANASTHLAEQARGMAGDLVSALSVRPVKASGETINLPLGSLDPGQQVTISFQVTLNNNLSNGVTQVCNQGTINADGGISVQTDDPSVNGPTNSTCSPLLDQTPPDTTIFDQPSNPTNTSTQSFSFKGTDNLTAAADLAFECALDSAPYSACTSPKTYTNSNLTDGSHTFKVRARDRAGNVDPTPAFYTWTSDTNPPKTTITSAPRNPSPSRSATFTFTATDGSGTGVVRFECMEEGRYTRDPYYAPCTSPISYDNLYNQLNTFHVRAWDAVGNMSETTYSWNINTILELTYLPIVIK